VDGGFQPRTLELAGGACAWQAWLPPGWSPGHSWPVILFLHGARERGDDGVRPTTVGLGPALLEDPGRWPAVVVFPQARDGFGWRGPMLRRALAALDDALLQLAGDPARQYLSGISMGAYGSWRLALENPERFAALVPICGGLDAPPSALARAAGDDASSDRPPAADPHAAAARILRELPTWIFHGDADGVIPVGESRTLVEAFRRAGAPVRYTEYRGVAHNSWDAAYSEKALTDWLFAQKR